jgi:hypothetical protein
LAAVQYRAFTLSEEKDIFPKNDMPFAKNWLRRKGAEDRNNPYKFQYLKPRGLGVGSFILFSYNKRIFGRARTARLVVRYSEQQKLRAIRETGFPYTGEVLLDPNSIQVFDEEVPKKLITARFGVIFSRNFTELNRTQYNGIVRLAGHEP